MSVMVVIVSVMVVMSVGDVEKQNEGHNSIYSGKQKISTY